MDNSEDYNQKSNTIRQLASLSPDRLIDHLTEVHPDIDTIAPEIAPHIHSTAINSIQFLNSKLPFAGKELIQDNDPNPSRAQKTAWLDLHETVNDPVSVLKHVENQTLNRHHLEALQTVYPDIHQEMIAKIQEQLGKLKESGEELPYSKRVSISKFIGQPLDSTLTQGSLQAIIQSATQNTSETQKQTSPRRSSGTEISQINKVNALYQTPSQRSQFQKSK